MCVINGAEGQFANRDDLQNVVVEMGLGNNTIPAQCFSGCINLTHITIPNGVVSIENYAFQNCLNLQVVQLPDTITTIGEFVFAGCNNLTTINWPRGVGVMPNNLIYDHSPWGRVLRESFLYNQFEDMFAALENSAGYSMWRDNYRQAAENFREVDWIDAPNEEVLELVAQQDNHIANVGQGLVAIGGAGVISNHIQDCREIVSHVYEIAQLVQNGNIAPSQISQEIGECREAFYQLFDVRPHVIFNRIVIAAFTNYVVPIPDEHRIQELVEYLNNFIPLVANNENNENNENWFILSHRIFESLSRLLPNRNYYELGCFAWILSNAIQNMNNNEHFEGEADVTQQFHNILIEAGLLN